MSGDAIDRTLLLPRSGIGVVAPWLVIAPPNRQLIKIDLRLLDRVELLSSQLEDGSTGDPDLLLACGNLDVAMHVVDGPDATRDIAGRAGVFTREATGQISTGDLGRFIVVDEEPVTLSRGYIVIGNRAFLRDQVREYALHGANLPLPGRLPGGRLLQAAIAMLVVAAFERTARRCPARC